MQLYTRSAVDREGSGAEERIELWGGQLSGWALSDNGLLGCFHSM
ncbi:MAG: hypothetical protein WD696_03430 [Bryobacteraceae bacterium]